MVAVFGQRGRRSAAPQDASGRALQRATMPPCTFATCSRPPHPDPAGRCAMDALRAFGDAIAREPTGA